MCRIREALLAVLVGLALPLGCSGQGVNSREAAPREAALTPTDLASMTLTQHELGAAYADFVAWPHSGIVTNKEAVEQAAESWKDRVTEGIVNSGRLSGYSRFFFAGTDLPDARGVWLIGSSVQVYEGETGAATAFDEEKNDSLGKDGLLRLDQTEFGGDFLPIDLPELGDASAGQTLTVDSASVPGSRSYWTRILFREGSVLGLVFVISADDRDLREDVRSLASALEEKVSRVLKGEQVEPQPLTARDILVQAQAELEHLSTIHVSQEQRVLFEGRLQSWNLDLDVEFPDRAIGRATSGGEPPLSLLVQGQSAYRQNAADDQAAWGCVEYANEAGLTVPDFWAEVDLADLTPDPLLRTEVDSAGRDVYVVGLNVDALDYFRDVSDLLAATGPVPWGPSIVQSGNAQIDLYIGAEDFLLHRYVVDLGYRTEDAQTITVQTDVAISDFNASFRFPELGMLPDCSYLDPPCYGRNVDSCLRPADELQAPNVERSACEGSQRRVCIVPLGAASPQLLQSLVGYYQRELGLDVRVLTAVPLLQQQMDQEWQQFDTDVLEGLMEGSYRQSAADPNVVLIGITPVDMNDLTESPPRLNFLFGQRYGQGVDHRFGVISYFRMNPETYGQPRDQGLLETRLRKMVTRYIGSLYYSLPDNSDPMSVLYESIGGLTDLDRIGEQLPADAVR